MIDMHVHSTESDGRLSIEEIQKTSNKNHIDEIAITDHDILMSADPELCNTNIIKAVEFGITYKNKEVHILGYYVDSSNENLRKISELAINDRANRIDIFEKNFAKFGIKIDKEKVLNYSKDKVFSRSNLAQYLVDINICKNKNEAFNEYLSPKGKCYVAKSFTSLQNIIDSIKSANGVCVLAHPITLNDDNIVDEIIEMGIDGIEVINSKHSFTDIKKYLNIAIKNKLIYTAGSDCHGKQFDGNYLMGNFALNYTTLKSIKKLHELRSNYVIK
ncbi:MAG: PHP domain-containing protein [Finegoldia magna]|nr:PHP domain-containing protein [Finegoldia magna]